MSKPTLQTVLITALIVVFPCVLVSGLTLKSNIKDYFVLDEDVNFDDTDNCTELKFEQYYLKTTNLNSSTTTRILNCLPQNITRDKYFPKCCPPNHIYHRKHHKCIENNNVTNIHESFGNETLLIRTDLTNCTVVLDHVLREYNPFFINNDKALNFNKKIYELGKYCLDNTWDDDNLVLKTCEDVNICTRGNVRCIKKCCPDGQYYKGASCHPDPHYGISLEGNTRFKDENEHFDAIMVGGSCRKYIGHSGYTYYITGDGTINIQEDGVWKKYAIGETYYCMEYVQMVQKHEILLCLYPRQVQPTAALKSVFLILSCICLLLTMIAYLIIPDLKNFLGKIIIIYTGCLLIAFTILTLTQFYYKTESVYCKIFGFSMGFLFLTAFSWMTVLSYEIWRVLGSMVSQHEHNSNSERRRLLWYNLFSWSIPIILTLITFCDYMYTIFPDVIHITLAQERCFYENRKTKGNYGYAFHFAVPCGVFVLVNIFIFVKTMIYICKVKNEMQRMKSLDTYEKQKKWQAFIADKEKIFMLLKISLVMGLSWIFETFSSIYIDFNSNDTLRIIEQIFDYFNVLQGVLIFCIFILKKKILKSVMKILKIDRKNRRGSVATCSTEIVMLPTTRTNNSH